MDRRSVPHSLSAAARVFCRDAADHFPTISDAVASPNFNDPAIRNRSDQQSTIRSAFSRVLSSAPACGYRALTTQASPPPSAKPCVAATVSATWATSR